MAFTFDNVLLGVTFLLNAGLVVLLLSRKNHKVFPFFFCYVLLNVFQGIALLAVYRIWGFTSLPLILAAWGTQLLVIVVRALAVAEICHRVLAKYLGVWKHARLLLLVASGVIAVLAFGFSRGNWRSAILSFDRGLELAIASTIVLLFVFARYYEVQLEPAVRTLATGFFLYSGFQVLNNTIAERWLTRWAMYWSLLGTLTFIASLLLWIWALRLTIQDATPVPKLLPGDHYRAMSPAINARLKSLNDRLGHLWGTQEEKT